MLSSCGTQWIDDVYATVFGQVISAEPGALTIQHSRTPWRRETWETTRF